MKRVIGSNLECEPTNYKILQHCRMIFKLCKKQDLTPFILSPSLFTGAILRGEPINVFNEGKMKRDFTYIDDIVEGVVRVIDKVAEPNPDYDNNNSDPATSFAPYRVYNIGNNDVVQLMDFIETIEDAVGKKAEKKMMGMQDGDVVATYANIDALVEAVGFKPATPLKEGVQKFVDWYKEYHGYN